MQLTHDQFTAVKATLSRTKVLLDLTEAHKKQCAAYNARLATLKQAAFDALDNNAASAETVDRAIRRHERLCKRFSQELHRQMLALDALGL